MAPRLIEGDKANLMSRSTELRQQRASLITQAQALMPTGGQQWSSEARTKFDAMMTDVDALKADIDRVEKVETLDTEMRSVVGTAGTAARPGSYAEDTGVDPKIVEAQQRAYRGVFNKYLRRGLPALNNDELTLLRSQGRSAEYRDQDNTSGPGGAYLIPQGFQNELEVALKYFGGMRQASRIITTAAGNVLPWPTTNDTTVRGSRLGANAVINPAQLASQTFGQVVFQAWTYTSGVIRVPNELLNDSAFDLEAEIRLRFAERIGRIQNNEFTLFTGSTGPNGVVNAAPTGVTGPTGETTGCSYNDVINLEHSVDPAYRQSAIYMFHDSTLAILRLLKDSMGRPIWAQGINAGAPDTINGYKYVINQDMPVMAANAKSMAFGDFSKYVIRDVAGSAVVMRLSELFALQNETAFVAFLRSDGQLLDAGTHPIALFQNSAT